MPAGYSAPVVGYGVPLTVAPVAATPPGTNAFAIVSLVLSICSGPLFGLIFGIVALVQTKRSGQKGRGLAIGGVTISLIWVVVGVVLIALNVAAIQRTETGRSNSSGNSVVNELKAGDCIETLADVSTSALKVVSCSEPHHAEVFAVFDVKGPVVYPGDDAVDEMAESGCDSRRKMYSVSGWDDEALTVYYLQPTRQSWSTENYVICVVSDDEHLRTGSIKD